MKLKASIGMDAVFSIILILMIVLFLEGASKNVELISKKIDKKQEMKRVLIEEAEKEKSILSSYKGNIDNISELVNYENKEYSVSKKRKIIEKRFGYVSSSIEISDKNNCENIKVYSILGEEIE